MSQFASLVEDQTHLRIFANVCLVVFACPHIRTSKIAWIRTYPYLRLSHPGIPGIAPMRSFTHLRVCFSAPPGSFMLASPPVSPLPRLIASPQSFALLPSFASLLVLAPPHLLNRSCSHLRFLASPHPRKRFVRLHFSPPHPRKALSLLTSIRLPHRFPRLLYYKTCGIAVMYVISSLSVLATFPALYHCCFLSFFAVVASSAWSVSLWKQVTCLCVT